MTTSGCPNPKQQHQAKEQKRSPRLHGDSETLEGRGLAQQEPSCHREARNANCPIKDMAPIEHPKLERGVEAINAEGRDAEQGQTQCNLEYPCQGMQDRMTRIGGYGCAAPRPSSIQFVLL